MKVKLYHLRTWNGNSDYQWHACERSGTITVPNWWSLEDVGREVKRLHFTGGKSGEVEV